MRMVNIHEAKTHLSRLVEMAAQGEPFIIARAGKPLVRVVPVQTEEPRRLGFLQGQFSVPREWLREDDDAADGPI